MTEIPENELEHVREIYHARHDEAQNIRYWLDDYAQPTDLNQETAALIQMYAEGRADVWSRALAVLDAINDYDGRALEDDAEPAPPRNRTGSR